MDKWLGKLTLNSEGIVVPLHLPEGLALIQPEGRPDGYTLDMLARDTRPDLLPRSADPDQQLHEQQK